MARSFGEALVGAFNTTYGTVTRGRLANEQAATMRAEREANERQRAEVRESQIRNGLLNPDGTTNDPGQNAQRANLQAPAAQPAEATRRDLGAPTSPAPTQGAAQPAPAPAPAPQPAPAPAAAQPPAAPAQAPTGGSPRGVVAQQGAAAEEGQAPAPGGTAPPIPQEVVERAAALVEQGGNNPADAMVVAGAMAPPPVRGPGGQGTQAQAAQYAQPLVQEIAQHRGEGQQGPLTRANWNAYLRDVTLASQRNLSPAQQVQALAVVDRIRVAGLQRFTALAVAAAQAGDMEGAARALNGASNFNPDGFQDTFRATQGGITMSRRPEEGNGRTVDVTVPAQDVVRYATAMLDPTWSLNHFLNVRRQDETERHNRADEGLRAASLAESRADRAERRTTRRAGEQADSNLARSWAAYNDARERGAPEAEVARLREAYTAAATAEGVTSAGVARIETLERQRTAMADRNANRRPLSADERRAFNEAEATYRDNIGRGGPRPEQQFALDNGLTTRQLNPGVSDRTVLDTLEAFRRDPSQFEVNRDQNAIRRRGGGSPALTLPPGTLQAPPPRSSNPSAPTETGTPPARGGAVSGARPNASPPLPGSLPPGTETDVRRFLGETGGGGGEGGEAPRGSRVRPFDQARSVVQALMGQGMPRDRAIDEVMRSGRYRIDRNALVRSIPNTSTRNLFPPTR